MNRTQNCATPCLLGHCYGSYPFSLSDYARQRHTYVIGKTGAGKSTLLLNMIAQDLEANRGICVIDPHGELARTTLSLIPTRRAHELVYIDPADTQAPVGFNPILNVEPDRRSVVANDVVAAMRHVWSDSWGARLEHLLYNGILLLQAIAKPNLVLLQRLYTDDDWRHRQLDAVTDPHILGYWRNEFDNLPANEKAIALSPVLNKVGRFTQDPFIRNIVAQSKPPFDLYRSMNEGRIVVVNLAKGRIGETPSHLLGAFFATSLAQAAYKRDLLPVEQRTSFTVYADELQSYATESFTAILSEARKYNLHLVLAHQFIDQLPDGLSEAILGNVGTVIVARVSGDDAELLAKHLVLKNPENLIELNNYEAFIRSLDNKGPTRLDIIAMAPPPPALHNRADELARNSRTRWGRERATIEAAILRHLDADKPSLPRPTPSQWSLTAPN